jgi:hypothetical protein
MRLAQPAIMQWDNSGFGSINKVVGNRNPTQTPPQLYYQLMLPAVTVEEISVA